MSIHKSLKNYPFKNKHKSVRKRHERFADAKLKGQKSVFSLPKEKRIKHKEKKEKVEEKKEVVSTLSTTVEKKKTKKMSKDIGKIK